jgi:hypothetical protein
MAILVLAARQSLDFRQEPSQAMSSQEIKLIIRSEMLRQLTTTWLP